MKENYDVAIIGAGPAGLYTAYGLVKQNSKLNIIIIEKGNSIEKRICPAIKNKTNCVRCKTCSIMDGEGGAGAFSDGKFPITNDFGGNLWEKIGKEKALELMRTVDNCNENFFKLYSARENKNLEFPRLYTSKDSFFKKICTQHNLHLLDADIRHLGTDYGQVIYKELINFLKANKVEIITNTEVSSIKINQEEAKKDFKYQVETADSKIYTNQVVVAAGRSGSKWVRDVCKKLKIHTRSNRVDLGVRFECPDEIWNHITKDLYESKITYRTKTYEDLVRTFCMNPSGAVVTENTNGGITVNGHSFEDAALKTNNTNFALLVSKTFTEPFDDSSEYGEAIIKLSNMLGGGVIVQRYGDLIRGKRSTKSRIAENTVLPTLNAEPGDLSLVLPKRILDDIIEMIQALDHLVPGMVNDDNLLYGVECKFYNNTVDVDEHLRAKGFDSLYFIGDGSGWTHSLSQSSASGLYVAEQIAKAF